MANMLGMDPAAVKDLAKLMDQGADQIQDLLKKLDGKLGGVQWKGSDQQRFMNDWNGKHKKALHQAATELKETASKARKDAEEQIKASS